MACDTFSVILYDPKTVKRMSSVAQIRGARGLLGWSQAKLADAAELSEPTVKRFETGIAKVSESSVQKMVAALEAAGVEFISENGGGAGVRLRKPAPAAIPNDE